ncbi:MAG: RNA-binding protein [Phycisphaerae bacterium]|nr:RNA-binding protein [Phycisphaerae bacterium]
MARLYAGNLSEATTEGELEAAFAPYGTVRSTRIIRDRQTSKSWGYGFVEMGDSEAASAAIAGLDGTELGGRSLKVEAGRRR